MKDTMEDKLCFESNLTEEDIQKYFAKNDIGKFQKTAGHSDALSLRE